MPHFDSTRERIALWSIEVAARRRIFTTLLLELLALGRTGTSHWHYAATATTGSNGGFAIRLPATGRWYKATYPGHSYYLPATSPVVCSS